MKGPSNLSLSHQQKPEKQSVEASRTVFAPVLPLPGELLAVTALLLTTLTSSPSRLRGVPRSADVAATLAALAALGANVAEEGDELVIRGLGSGVLLQPQGPIDVSGAPVAAALLIGLVSSHCLPVTFLGEALERRAQPFLPIGLQVTMSEEAALSLCGPRAAPPLTWQVPVADPLEVMAILLSALNTSGITRIVLDPATPPSGFTTMFDAFGLTCEAGMDASGRPMLILDGRQVAKPCRIGFEDRRS